jgi:hypothetical protein
MTLELVCMANESERKQVIYCTGKYNNSVRRNDYLAK